MKFIQIAWHVWKLGHSVETRHFSSELAKTNDGKGWLHRCSCGRNWSQ